MPASKAEQVLDALKALLETVPGAVIERNSALPEKIPDGGLIILRDGDPGEPEQALGGFGNAYYQHAIEIEIHVEQGDAAARDAAFDDLLQQIGAVLEADPDTTDNLDGSWDHEFASGGDDLPSYTLEVGMQNVPAFFRHAGVKLNSIALEFTRSGAAAATISAIAQGETRFGTTQGGTPTSLTFSRISQFQGSIKRAGSPVGNLTGGSVTYSNNLEKIETIRDDGLIEGADPTIAALTGRIDVRFADTTLIDLAAGGTPVDLEFAYTLSAQAKLVLSAHEVYLPKPKLAVEGPGGVQASFDFRGAKNDVAGRMLTVTLTNDLDGLVYG